MTSQAKSQYNILAAFGGQSANRSQSVPVSLCVLAAMIIAMPDLIERFGWVLGIAATAAGGAFAVLLVWAARRTWRWIHADDVLTADVTRLLGEAVELRNRIRADGSLRTDPQETERLCREFERHARDYLIGNYLAGIGRFDSDLTSRPERYQPDAPFHISNWGNWIERRIEALEEIIKELK
jgi:hypothetical protein